jgi:hypothetical protein
LQLRRCVPLHLRASPGQRFCESVLFWHVRSGHYGDINLDDLNFVRVGRWEGDIWAGKAKGVSGMFIVERADEPKRKCFPAFLAAVQEDFRDWLLRCSPKVGSLAVWSGRGSPSRSHLIALNGE